jgi:integrase
MARIRRGAEFGTREARRRLKGRPEPYWMPIDRGLSLGYRKSTEGGSWVMRRYIAPVDPKRGGRHTETRIGTADDSRDADGVDVLAFGQAQRKLLAEARQQVLHSSGQLYSVADAARDYVDWQRAHRKSASDTQSKLKYYVLPTLGEKRVADLKQSDFQAWLAWALKRRRKAKKKAATGGETAAPPPLPPAPTPDDLAERQRRRKATLNRVINALKACLNFAHANDKVPSRDAWSRLKKFRSADSSRLRWLTVDEAIRLQNACAPGLRPLVSAGLLTGCRAGELLAMHAGDFDLRSKTVLVADSKAGKPRRVVLTDDGVKLFDGLTAGKLENESIFTRADGSAWYRVALVREMHHACTAAKVSPAATFHTLRHTFASHLVQQGVPLMFVASALGHSDTRMVEKHYGHLSQSAVADMIRAKLPSFGAPPATKVTSLRGKERA